GARSSPDDSVVVIASQNPADASRIWSLPITSAHRCADEPLLRRLGWKASVERRFLMHPTSPLSSPENVSMAVESIVSTRAAGTLPFAREGSMDAQRMLHRRRVLAATAAVALARSAKAQTEQPDPWPSLSAQIFNGSTALAIDAPYRAIDAAAVPVIIHTLLPPDDARSIRSITLTIDENPSPLAAVFTFGAGSGVRTLAMRLRVD